MAFHCLLLKNKDEFYTRLKNFDAELIVKLVTCVLGAHKRKLDRVAVFDITFKNSESMVFSVEESQYKDLLATYLLPLENLEEYELCAGIMKILKKKKHKPKPKIEYA